MKHMLPPYLNIIVSRVLAEHLNVGYSRNLYCDDSYEVIVGACICRSSVYCTAPLGLEVLLNCAYGCDTATKQDGDASLQFRLLVRTVPYPEPYCHTTLMRSSRSQGVE